MGEGSGVNVCAAVGRIVSKVSEGSMAGRVLVGSGVPVVATAGVDVHAVRKTRAATMSFFMAGNYMTVNVAANAPRNDMRRYGVAPTKLNAYNASSYPGRTESALRQSSTAPLVFP